MLRSVMYSGPSIWMFSTGSSAYLTPRNQQLHLKLNQAMLNWRWEIPLKYKWEVVSGLFARIVLRPPVLRTDLKRCSPQEALAKREYGRVPDTQKEFLERNLYSFQLSAENIISGCRQSMRLITLIVMLNALLCEIGGSSGKDASHHFDATRYLGLICIFRRNCPSYHSQFTW